MKIQTQQGLELRGMQLRPELTRAAAELFGELMTPACRISSASACSSKVKIGLQLGVYDVVGVHCSGPPPHFGKYANCHFDRRCLGCERECSGDPALVDLAIGGTRPMLLVLAGGASTEPSWLRVIVIDPGKTWSGGVFTPMSFRYRQGIVLKPASCGTCLVVTAEGLLMTGDSPGKPWLVAPFDRARHLFCSSLYRNRPPKSETSQHLQALEWQGV